MLQQWKKILEIGRWKERKKSDWVVLALVGVLLLVIAVPFSDGKKEGGQTDNGGAFGTRTPVKRTADSVGEEQGQRNGGQRAGAGNKNMCGEGQAYAVYLEEKLEGVLSQMEGVGRVKVMVTVSDAGESVVEKDVTAGGTVTSESDGAGGNRMISENTKSEQTVYLEGGGESYPYIQKEKLPTVEGVVVVAEGGGNSVVISNISESVKALLPVEAHRIKVVKMGSKEE